MSGRSRSPLAIVLLATVSLGAAADARDNRNYNNGYYGGNNNYWENRRDARRVGAVAGVVAMGVASSAGNARVDNAYEDCAEARAYGGYPANCEQQRYYDQRNARRGAVVTGVAVGRTARIIAY